jgi:hypothetical protein
VSSSYHYYSDNELQEKFKWSFSCAIDKSDFLRQSKDFRTIEGWYNQAKKASDSIASSSMAVNEMINELLKHVYPRYTHSVIDQIGINTHFIGGVRGVDFDIGIISMKPYVEFVKIVDGKPMPPVRFTFQLDIDTHVSIIKTPNTPISNYIEIKKLGIELKIWLLHMPYIYLNHPIRLTTTTFDNHKQNILTSIYPCVFTISCTRLLSTMAIFAVLLTAVWGIGNVVTRKSKTQMLR